MSQTHEPKLEQVKLADLCPHPLLAGFPALTVDQFAALKISIRRDGILKPLLADSNGRIVDGRHRLRAAEELNMDTVPVIRRDDIDPLHTAVESAVIGRNLTKSGVALLVFENHPGITEGREERKTLFLKRGKSPTNPRGGTLGHGESEEGSAPTFRRIADEYKFDRDLLTILSELWDEATDKQWGEIRTAVLRDEFSLPRIRAGFYGGKVKVGSKKLTKPGPKLLVEWSHSFAVRAKAWGKASDVERHAILKNVAVGLNAVPEFKRELVNYITEARGRKL